MQVVILNPCSSIREEMERVLINAFGRVPSLFVRSVSEYPERGSASLCMKLAAIEEEWQRPGSSGTGISVIVLEPHLGQSERTGLEVVKATQHCFPRWRFVIFDYVGLHLDREVRVEAEALGIRFATTEIGELPSLVKAASEVSHIRSITAGWATNWFHRPITPYAEVEHTLYHLELLQLVLKFGLRYTGAREDVDWEALESISHLAQICYDAALSKHYAMHEPDSSYFENSYTTLSFLVGLEEEVIASLAVTDSLVFYR